MTDTNEPPPGFGEVPESAQDWAKQDAAQIAAAQQGRYKDTTEPPAFGPQRNAALAELQDIDVFAEILGSPYGYKKSAGVSRDALYNRSNYSAVPDYCGSNADCFRLLAELNALNWIVGITCAMYASAACTVNTTLRSEIEPCDYLSFSAQSELEEEADALRDAITAAAWKALTAQKEGEVTE